jgi:hypothetical protein
MKHYVCRAGTFCIGIMSKVIDLISDIKFVLVITYTIWRDELKLIYAKWTLSGIYEYIKLLIGGVLSAFSVSLIKLDKLTKIRRRYREDMYTSALYITLCDLARAWNYIYVRN